MSDPSAPAPLTSDQVAASHRSEDPPLQSASARHDSWAWVPIRSLAPRHRERVVAHLIALDDRARYLRYGYAATDAQIARYVDTLDFERDEVFGIFNRRLDLVAMAHLAHAVAPRDEARPAMSEFGVSVLAHARRRGFGRRLFEHAILHARNRGIHAIFIHALSENTPMLKIARDAGATVRREGSETEAWLELPPDSLASHIDELVGTQAAEFDYRLKARVQQVGTLLGLRPSDRIDAEEGAQKEATQSAEDQA